jgi:hypothetical protein
MGTMIRVFVCRSWDYIFCRLCKDDAIGIDRQVCNLESAALSAD